MAKYLAGLVLLLAVQAASASGQDCRDARRGYKEAKEEIPELLRRYASCVKSAPASQLEDCAAEFEKLRSAQEALEDAAQAIRTECE